ncbi:DUF6788 family protein [Haloquadratum walsbyi]|uniref:DUF6788 family protein n=1 Tax=Haloquadratum walsbyi TaxID=293091 RepID=UPI00373FDBD4
MGGWVYTKYIECGKETCHCKEEGGHGPYRYGYYYDDSGNLTSEYLGKVAE